MSDKIKVGVKVRPLIERERASKSRSNWKVCSTDSICQVDPENGSLKGEPFYYDHVFSEDSSNREVFEVLVKPIVQATVKGFNGTIFAYGQTSSGKTYTMMGDQFEIGVIPLTVDYIFNAIENTPGREFLMRVAYMEIYNEKVNDLLKKGSVNLKVVEDGGNVVVKDLSEMMTNSPQMVMDIMKKGEHLRKIGETCMNDRSSRSHTIFRIIVESREVGDETDGAVQVSHLNLVDLAGSERAGATGAVGERFREGCAINKSLFMLGQVIAKLSEGEIFVNFRDSKLTRILQSSLGGNALTAIVCAITPASIDETAGTLGFAARARNIKNTAKVNEVVSDSVLMKRYAKRIKELNFEIGRLKDDRGDQELQIQLEEKMKQNMELQVKLDRLQEFVLVSRSSEPEVLSQQKLRQLRRQTWSAPAARQSYRPLQTPSLSAIPRNVHFGDLKEEDSRLSISSIRSEGCDDSAFFGTPLEEFERDLMRVERNKSLESAGRTPPHNPVISNNEDISPFDEGANFFPPPPGSFVQMRRRQVMRQADDAVVETPPSKLRERMEFDSTDFKELDEFLKLEKQVYNDELEKEILSLQSQLSKCREELCEEKTKSASFDALKEELDFLRSSDRSLADLQLLLLDANKNSSKLTDMNKQLTSDLDEARKKCSLLEDAQQALSAAELDICKLQKEKHETQRQLQEQAERLRQLEHQKEDFDMQMEIVVSKHARRENELTKMLEDAWKQLEDLGDNTTARIKPCQDDHTLQAQEFPLEDPMKASLQEKIDLLVSENTELQEAILQKNKEAERLKDMQQEILDLHQELDSLRRPARRLPFFRNLNTSLSAVEEEPSVDDSMPHLESERADLNQKLPPEENCQKFQKSEGSAPFNVTLSEVSEKTPTKCHCKERATTFEQEGDVLMLKLQEASQEIDELQHSLDQKNKLVASLETALQDLGTDSEQQLLQMKESRKVSDDLISSLQKEISSLKERHSIETIALEEQKIEMEEAAKIAKLQIDQLEEKLVQLSDSLESSKQEIEQLKSQMGMEGIPREDDVDLSPLIDALTEELKQLNSTVEAKEEILQKVRALTDDNSNLATLLANVLKELECTLITVKDIEHLKRKILDLQEENVSLTSSVNAKTHELESAKSSLNESVELQAKIEDLKQENERISQLLRSLKDELEHKEKHISVDSISSLHSEMETLEEEKRQLIADLEKCRQEMAIVAESEIHKNLLCTIESLQEENGEKKKLLEQSLEKKQALEEEIKKLEKERNDLTLQLEATSNDVESATHYDEEELCAQAHKLREQNLMLQNKLERQLEPENLLKSRASADMRETEKLQEHKIMDSSLLKETENESGTAQASAVTVELGVDHEPQGINSPAMGEMVTYNAEPCASLVIQESTGSQLPSANNDESGILNDSSVSNYAVNKNESYQKDITHRILDEKLEALENKNAALQKELDQLREENGNLLSQLSHAERDREELKSLRVDLEELADCLKSRSKEVADLQDEVDEYKKALSKPTSEVSIQTNESPVLGPVDQNIAPTVEDAKAPFDETEPSCPSDLVEDIGETTLTSESSFLVSMTHHSDTLSELKSEEIEDLFQALYAEKERQSDEIKALNAELQQLKTLEVPKLMAEVECLKKDNESLHQEMLVSESRVKELTLNLDALREDNQNLSSMLKNKEQEGKGDELAVMLDNLKSERDATVLEVKKLRELAEDNLSKISILSERNEDLQSVVNDKMKEVIALKEVTESYLSMISGLKEENEGLQSTINEKINEVVKLRTLSETRNEELLDDVRELQERNVELMNLLQEKSSQDMPGSEDSSVKESEISSTHIGSAETRNFLLDDKLKELENEVIALTEAKVKLSKELEEKERLLQLYNQGDSSMASELEELAVAEKILIQEISSIKPQEGVSGKHLRQLVPEFLSAVMEVQQRCIAVLQNDMEEKCSLLEEELKASRHKVKQNILWIEQVEAEAKQMCEDELVKCSQQIEEFRIMLSESQKNYEALVEDLCSLVDDCDDPQTVIMTLKDNLSELAIKTKDVEKLQEEISNYKTKIIEENDSMDSLRAQLEAKESVVQELTDKIKAMDHIVKEGNKDPTVKELQAQIGSLESELPSKENQYRASQDRADSLYNEVNSQKLHISKLEDQLAQKEAEVHALQEEMVLIQKSSEQTTKELTDANASHGAQLAAKESVIQELKDKITAMEHTVTELQAQIASLESELPSKENQYRASQDRADSLYNEVNSQKLHISKLEDQLAQKEAEVHALQEEMVLIQKSSEQTTKELTDANASHGAQLAAKESVIQELKDTITAMEHTVTELQAQIDSLESELPSKENQYRASQDRADSLYNEVNSQKEHISKLEDQLSQKMAEVHASQEEIVLIQKSSEQTTKELTDVNASLGAQLAAKESVIQELKDKITAMDHVVKAQEEEDKGPLVRELQEKIHNLHSKLTMQEKQFTMSRDKANSLFNAVNAHKEHVSKLEDQLAQKESLIITLKEEVASMKISLEQCEKDLEKTKKHLQIQCNEKESALKLVSQMKEVTVDEEIKELKAENQYLKDQLKDSVKASRQTRLANNKLLTQVTELKQKLEEENQKLQSSGPETSVEVMKLKTQLANREQEIQQVCMQLAQNKEIVVKLKAEMEMAGRERAEQEAQVDQDCKSIGIIRSQRMSKAANWKQRRQSIREGEMESLKEEVQSLRVQKETWKSKFEMIESQLLQCPKKLGQVELEMTANLDVNKKVHELENAVKLRERTISDKEKMIMDLESRISSLGSKEIVDVQTLLKEKDSKILELEKSVAELNKECDELCSWGRGEEKERVHFNDLYYAEQTEHAKHRSSCNHRRAESVLNLVLRSKELLALLPQETSEQLIMQLRSREIAAKNTITRAAALIEQLPSIEKHSSASQALLKDLSSEDHSLCNLEKETVSLWNTCVSKVRIIKEEITALKEKTSLLQADLDVERAKVSQLCKKTPLLANLYVSANSETAQKLKQLTSENEELKSKVSSLEQPLHHSPNDAVASVHEVCRCNDLLKQAKELRVNLADAKAKITQLEMQLQVKNLPAQKLIEDLKEQLKTLKETNAELKKDNRRLMKSAQETTFRECPACQMRLRNLSNAETQTTISSSNLTEKVVGNQYWLSGAPSGIVQEYTELTLRDRVRQLETEKEMLKKVCRSRNTKIDELQKQLLKPKAPEMKEQENMEPNNQQVGRPTTRSQVKKMT